MLASIFVAARNWRSACTLGAPSGVEKSAWSRAATGWSVGGGVVVRKSNLGHGVVAFPTVDPHEGAAKIEG